jgi:hypothetical protein
MDATHEFRAAELATRARLRIPSDAKQVLIFGESSHWDTNWLQTSEEYFRDHIDGIFDAIFNALSRDERRVFAIESVFFLKMYWERRPQKRDLLRALLNSKRLRVLSASMTTPDTLLPPTETILRDFLAGQAWLHDNGIEVTPNIAYFPDNFGHSPALPSLMRSLGIHGVGITRIDGMYFVASDYRAKSDFPLKGSTADALQNAHKSADFVWRNDDGAEVLCHWNAFTYFQGDMLASLGIIRWMNKTVGVSWRTGRHVARRIKQYVKELSDLALTPYLFCPIGCDFNHPILDLGPLVDRYNAEIYPKTGVYATLAGLDDYLDLVDFHREKLPVLAADPNPYWMGFYASRPEVKQRPTRISRTLVLAEKLSALKPVNAEFRAHAAKAWNLLLLSNHHDYITGTSPDRVWHGEQRTWLDEAESAAADAWKLVVPILPEEDPENAAPVQYTWQNAEQKSGDLQVVTPHYQLTISPERGGCITRFLGGDGSEVLEGVGNDLIVYRDTGGLWRMGHEFAGGTFKPIARASKAPAQVVVHEHPGELSIVITSELRGRLFTRMIWCRSDSPFLRMRVTGEPKARWTVCAAFGTTFRATKLTMDGPGGRTERPLQKLYDPTFWPVSSHCQIDDENTDRHGHFLFDTPAAIAFGAAGEAEWIVARNATKERAFGVLPVLAHPIGGTSHESQTFDYAVGFASAEAERDMTIARDAFFAEWLPEAERGAWHAAHAFVRCDDPHVTITAVKHSENGEGLIVRLARPNDKTRDPLAKVRLTCLGPRICSAWLTDARELGGRPLAVVDGVAQVPLRHSLTTVRIVLE